MNPNHIRILRRVTISLFALLVVVAGGAVTAWCYFASDPASETESLVTVLALEPGMTVAEIGAGDGEMTVLMAQRLGPDGRMYTTEMGASKQEEIREAVEDAALSNVTVLEAAERSTNLPEACCDAIFMRKVYHHITDPGPFAVSLFDSLRPGGRLAVIDFQPKGWTTVLPDVTGVPENRGGHGMPMDLLVEELTGAGFEIERSMEDWSRSDYCVVARRPIEL